MPTPERIRTASLAKRQRVCTICGAQFTVRSADRKGVACSPPCMTEVRRRNSTGRKFSAESKAKKSASIKAFWSAHPEALAARTEKAASAMREWLSDPVNAAAASARSSARMKALHQDPQFQVRRNERSARTMRANWEKHRDLYIAQASERYINGIGLNSDEANAKRSAAAAWIMKRAQAALHTETNYDAVYADVQARLRREMPYDGPKNESDYYDYLKNLGKATVSHPECRSIADHFMAEAIPRFSAQWRNRRKPHHKEPLTDG